MGTEWHFVENKIAQIVLEHNIHEKIILNLLEAVLPKTVKRYENLW